MNLSTDAKQTQEAARRKPLPAAMLKIDSREQLPYQFRTSLSQHISFAILKGALPEGDYAAHLVCEDGPEATAVIERKSLSDLYGSLTHNRERFERELERLRPYGFKALIVEGDLPAIARGGLRPDSQVNPRSIVASLIAFSQRFNVHVVFAGDRRHAELYAFRLLERWVRDRAEARKAQEVAHDIH